MAKTTTRTKAAGSTRGAQKTSPPRAARKAIKAKATNVKVAKAKATRPKKAASKGSAKRRVFPGKEGSSPPTGSWDTLRLRNHLRSVVLELTDGMTRAQGGEHTGLREFDINNLRCGNGVSSSTLMRLVAEGRFDPDSLLFGDRPRRLRADVSTKGGTLERVARRVAELARARPARELALEAGVAPITIYSHRVVKKMPGIDVLLGFILSGVSAKYLLLGIGKPRALPRGRAKKRTQPHGLRGLAARLGLL